METFWQDIRYGLRMLLKAPSFSIVATIALALGIGANTAIFRASIYLARGVKYIIAIFSVVNAVLLRPLPFANAEQLMMVWETNPSRGQKRGSASYPNFADWRAQNSVFERMSTFYNSDYILTGQGDSTRLQGAVVNADLFPLLMLFGVTAKDPITFAVVSGLLAAVALLACYIPAAGRASGSDRGAAVPMKGI